MAYLHELIFGLFPYIAGTVFLVGSLLRFEVGQFTWRTGSSQLLSARSKQLIWGSRLFHVGILLLFFGHLVGLLMPHSWYGFFGLTAASKQQMAMMAGGIFGTMCLVGATMLLHRRLTNERVKATSNQGDIFILVLLYIQLIFGLLTIFVSVQHPDGSVMVMLADWAQRVVTFRDGAADAIIGIHWIYKAHLFLGITMFMVFPFTRLVHVWSAPLSYVARRYQIVRQRMH